MPPPLKRRLSQIVSSLEEMPDRAEESSRANDVRPYGEPFEKRGRGDVACYPWASLPSPFPLGDGLGIAPYISLFKGNKSTPLPCRASPLKEETFAANAQNANTAHTGKGKQKRLQAPGGQRGTSDSAGRVERVFPRAVFSGIAKDYRANNVRPYKSPCQLR